MTQALVKKGLVGKAVLEEPPKPQSPSSPMKASISPEKNALGGMCPFISYANGYFM